MFASAVHLAVPSNPVASRLWLRALGAVPARRVVVVALIVLLVTLLLGLLADGFIARLLLDQAASRAADEVQLGLVDRVTEADFDPPFDWARLADLAARLDPVIVPLRTRDPEILRINVVARDGVVLYSDRASVRGRAIPLSDKPELETALDGGIGADDTELGSEENVDLAPAYGRALEVYVPVRLNGQVRGAYEIYEDLSPLRMARALVALILAAPWCLAVLAWCAGRMRRRAWAADYTTSPPAAIATPEPVGAVVEPVPARNANRDWRTRLTPREMEVLRLMATARTNRAIARELGVSEETVRSHVKRVLHKLDQPDRTQAVLAAVRNGLLDLQ